MRQRQGESEKGSLIPLNNRKMNIMQNFLDLEERLKDLTTDLQKLKEEFASTVANPDALRVQNHLLDEDLKNKNRSFFGMLNGKSKPDTETVL